MTKGITFSHQSLKSLIFHSSNQLRPQYLQLFRLSVNQKRNAVARLAHFNIAIAIPFLAVDWDERLALILCLKANDDASPPYSPHFLVTQLNSESPVHLAAKPQLFP